MIRRGKADGAAEVRVARRSALVIGPIAVLLAVALRRQNVAPVAVLAFAGAASSNFPVLLLSIYWRRFNTDGALAGILGGLSSCLFLMAIGPAVMGPSGFILQDTTPLFPLENPGIVSIPIGFLAAYLGTVTLGNGSPSPGSSRRSVSRCWPAWSRPTAIRQERSGRRW